MTMAVAAAISAAGVAERLISRWRGVAACICRLDPPVQPSRHIGSLAVQHDARHSNAIIQ
jgi:hypothetical protein